MGLSDLIADGMDATAATELLLNVVWTIVGATLVYFMQAGFAMCEAGFTRAKNTGNILMKNMMDFVLGSLFFFIFGFAIMHGTDWNGIIGIKGFFNTTCRCRRTFQRTANRSLPYFPYSILRHIRYHRIRFYGRTYKIPCLLII
mgnify:CR=1 FL=1